MEKIALVTGSTDGIGFETALELARRGFRILLHGRDPARLEAVARNLEGQCPGMVGDTLTADYADLAQVRDMGRKIAARWPRLTAVVHNAGTFQNARKISEDGWELTWQINHLAPALLNEYVMRPLDAGAPSRLVWVSSIAHTRGKINWNDLNGDKGYSGYGAYAASKLANALYAFKLARMMDHRRLGIFALHPGVIPTKLLKEGFGKTTGIPLVQGARTSVILASDPSLEGRSGEYWSEGMPAQASDDARDEDLQDQLHSWTQQSLALIS